MEKYQTRWFQAITTAASLVAVMGITSLAALANDDSHIVLNPGTVIPVTLNTELSSRTANAGDTFTATVDTSRGYYGRIMDGATVTGYVKSVTPKSGDQPGMLDVVFTRLDLPDGTNYTIDGEPTGLDSKSVTTDSDGMLVAKNTHENRGLKFAGIGAGAGALVGVLATGGLSLWDTLAGAGIGYGASTVNKPPSSPKYHDVDLHPGTQLGVLLGSKVTYYHRAYPTAYAPNFGGPIRIGIDQDESAMGLPLPSYSTPDSVGMSIVAANDRDVTIAPGGQATITTGLRFSIPTGFEAQLRPDEMPAQRDGLSMMNGPMIIDANDHRIVRVTLFNSGQGPVTIHRGDRIARLVVTQVVHAQLNQSSF